MASRNRRTFNWTGLQHALSGALKEVPARPEDELAWAQLEWEMIVGSDLASVSRVKTVGKDYLTVELAAEEWRPSLKGLSGRLLTTLNRRFGEDRFSRIHYRVAEKWASGPIRPRPWNPKGNPIDTPEEEYESLSMIQDPDLRGSLARISRHLHLVGALIVCALFLVSCATPPGGIVGGGESSGVSSVPGTLDDSYAVRRIEELNRKDAGAELTDPRAYYHFLMALKFEREGDFDQAAVHYRELVQHDPSREGFQEHYLELLVRTGQLEQALQHGEKAVSRFPSNWEMHRLMGDLLMLASEPAEALEHYLKARDLEPKSSRVLVMVGQAREALGSKRQAIESYKEATLVDTHNPITFYYYGRSLLHSKRYDEAEAELQKALNLRPSLMEARKQLAATFVYKKEYAKASEQYQVLNKLIPRDDLKAYIEVLQKRVTGSSGGQASPLEPLEMEELGFHALMGAVFYEQAAYLESLDEFRLALLKREDLDLRLIISKIYELLGRYDKAIQEFEAHRAAVQDQTYQVNVLLNLARLYGLNREMDKSVELLNLALKEEPRNDRLYHSLALAHLSLKQYDQAIKAVNKAIELDDQRDAYFFELGSLYERVGDLPQAIIAMERVLAINPNHSNAHNFIGYLYALQGTRLDDAILHLEKALRIQPRNGYFLDSLGWIYFKKGEPEKALQQIKKAMIYVSPDPVLYDHLGEVHFHLNQFQEAQRAWKISLSLTLKRLDDPSGELPDPKKLEEKLNKTRQLLNPVSH